MLLSDLRCACQGPGRALGPVVLLLSLMLALLPARAEAQNRLAVELGPMFPIRDMSDAYDPSLWIGARWELQRVNPLGNAALVSLVVQGGFSSLEPNSDLKTTLEGSGQSTSGSYFTLGLGGRVYAATIPFFLSASAGWANFDPAGGGSSYNGLDSAVGGGFSVGLAMVHVESEFKAHLAALNKTDNLQYLTWTFSVALPF